MNSATAICCRRRMRWPGAACSSRIAMTPSSSTAIRGRQLDSVLTISIQSNFRRRPKLASMGGAMEFGMQFFPCVGPDQKSGSQYFDECLRLVDNADRYGWAHIRTVEHYFRPYGGYTPNPIVFLSAAAQRTKTARLITGAVLPIFNNPLKLAGEIGMLDAISGGRLEVGFARAFLPHEFARFGVSVNESRARFEEGMAQVRLLLTKENVSADGRFHSFKNVTSLPRPTQRPHPPFWVAALSTPESFTAAGAAGHFLMAIPFAGARMRELLGLYRDAWRAAGHPGRGRV